MQIVKGIRISLTLQDIIQHIGSLTKQQLIQKFRIMLDRKQMQLNEQIQKNNAEHLLVLQKKMIILEKKDDQIIKHSNTITTLKSQLREQQTKNNQQGQQLLQAQTRLNIFERKYIQAENLFKQQKTKRFQLKKQLQKQIQQQKAILQKHQQQIRYYKKFKDEKANIEQSTQMLINKQIKKHQAQMQVKIKNMKLEHQHKMAELNLALQEEKKKHQFKKQKYMEAKNTILSLNKGMEILNKQLLNEKNKQLKQKQSRAGVVQAMTQTQDNNSPSSMIRQSFKKQVIYLMQPSQLSDNERNANRDNKKANKQINEKQAQTQQYQCEECRNLRNSLRNIQLKLRKSSNISISSNKTKIDEVQLSTTGSQTNPQKVVQKDDKNIQTMFKALPKQQQLALISSIKIIKQSSAKLINSYKKKYEQLERFYEDRPPRKQDLQNITLLQKQVTLLQLAIVQKQKEIKNKQFVIFQLHKKISSNQAIIKNRGIQQLQMMSISKTDENTNIKSSTLNQFLNSKPSKQKLRQRTPIISRSKTIKIQCENTNRFKSHSNSNNHSSNNSININFQNERIKTQMNVKNKVGIKKNFSLSKQKYENNQGKLFESSPKPYSKVNQLLIQRGIVFKQKINKDNQQISQARNYKRFMGSHRKINL